MIDKVLIEENQKAKEAISDAKDELRKKEEHLNRVASDSQALLAEIRDKGLSYKDLVESLRLVQEDIDSIDTAEIFMRNLELRYLIENPFFARIDLLEKKGQDEKYKDFTESFYLAKFGLFKNGKPILIDWRTKVASLYYKNKYQRTNVSYEVDGESYVYDIKLKRTFEIDNGEVIKYFNNDIGISENEIVIDKIKNRTGGVLEDIIETIQESQMEIIEADPREVCIVQGTVGSGKSTVAIHKLSYIFFNYPKIITPSRTILISKSRVLVDYLSSLFPRLGIFDLKYKTIRDILFKYLTENPVKIKFNLELNTDISDINIEFCQNLQKIVLQYKKESIDELKKIIESSNFENLVSFNFSLKDPANNQVEEVLSEITDTIEMLREQNKSIRPTELQHEKNKNTIFRLSELRKKIKNERNNLLIRKFKDVLKRFGIDKFLGYKEALIFLYSYYEFFGFKESEMYEYAVVDEAQDMSILETLIVSKLVKFKRMCMIGDLNQNIHNNPVSTWEEIFFLFEDQKISTYQLETNYRSTRNIITYANEILKPFTQSYLPKSIEKFGSDVIEIQYQGESTIESFTEEIVKDSENLNKSIGVIFYKFVDEDKILGKLQASIRDPEKLIYLEEQKTTVYQPRAIYVTDFENCKGLEFSKVYLFGFNKDSENFNEAKKFFVGSTRAMNDLVIYYQ